MNTMREIKGMLNQAINATSLYNMIELYNADNFSEGDTIQLKFTDGSDTVMNLSKKGDTVYMMGCYHRNFKQHDYIERFFELIKEDTFKRDEFNSRNKTHIELTLGIMGLIEYLTNTEMPKLHPKQEAEKLGGSYIIQHFPIILDGTNDSIESIAVRLIELVKHEQSQTNQAITLMDEIMTNPRLVMGLCNIIIGSQVADAIPMNKLRKYYDGAVNMLFNEYKPEIATRIVEEFNKVF